MRVTVFPLGGLVLLLLLSPYVVHGAPRPSSSELLRQFKAETVFWRQFELAESIVAANDTSVLPSLEPWLTNDDRRLRGNAAYIFSRFGDPRGFDVIVAILGDRSEKRDVHKISSVGTPWIQGQIIEDRYYAAHLMGDLKDPRAVPILVRLLTDPDVNYIVPWSLGKIGDRSAITPLIGAASDSNPSMRVLAIHALVQLEATEALPRLRQLRADNARSNFGSFESVSAAAEAAIAILEPETAR